MKIRKTAALEALRICRKLYPWRAEEARKAAARVALAEFKKASPYPRSYGVNGSPAKVALE